MSKLSLVFLVTLVLGLGLIFRPPQIEAAGPRGYYKAQILQIKDERRIEADDMATGYVQTVLVEREDTGEKIELEVGTDFQPLNQDQKLSVGKTIILADVELADGTSEYVVSDVYRLPTLAWLLVGFLIVVILVARWQGLFSIMGMAISLAVLSGVMVPQILAGANPLWVSLIGSTAIATLTVYLSHGFEKESHLALASMIATLVVVVLLSAGAVRAAQLVGLGSEEAYFLQFGETAKINLQGLLLGGIVLGALGILDDITIAQISIVKQLLAVNPKISFTELYERGLSVGKDHVASLVNTLVLAYAGANLPLFILFTLNRAVPWWVTLNNEIIAEEVVRTLVGSMGLVLAVPLATLVGALVLKRSQAASAEAVSPVTSRPRKLSTAAKAGRIGHQH